MVLDNIEEYFVKSRYDKLIDIKLRFVGRIMDILKDVFEPRNKENWIEWIINMIGFGGIYEKRSISVSIGGILRCNHLDDKIIKLWQLLEKENDTEINNNLVLMLGFLASFGREKQREIQIIIRKYLKNSTDHMLIIPQYFIIAKELNMEDEILQILIEKIDLQLKMRELLLILSQLILFSNDFECINKLNPLIPLLIQASKTSTLPIKEKSLELLSVILYKSPCFSNKINLSKEIINNFANSTISYNRASFIHFCLCIKNLCSKNFFCKLFMPSLLTLAKDQSNLVKYTFAKNYVTFRYLVPLNDTELAGNLRYILNYYLELDDKILLNYALAADKLLNNSNWELIHYGKNSENIENQKIKKEQDEETKEIIEAENLKRVQNEENSRGIRKSTKKNQTNFVNNNVSRQSSVKPIKKYNLSETDKFEVKLNRTMVRVIKKK